VPFVTVGQDLENFGDKDPVQISGSLSGTSTFYHTDGPNQRDPFYWLLSGNVTLSLYGVSIPISATITQQNRSFTQPFNQYGLSPHYKAVTLHLGYRSMNFSEFTLGGNIFLGGGFEVAPENSKVSVSGMYGQLVKPVAPGRLVDGVINGEPAFKRLGYAGKVTFGKQANGSVTDLIMFRAKDIQNSINTDSLPDLKPAENIVMGIHTMQKLADRVTLDLQYAFSAYTLDTRVNTPEDYNYSYFDNLGSLFRPNATTQYNGAIAGNIQYTSPIVQLKLAYRRVDPEYKTMGSVFLVNDIEDVTGSASWRMFNNKVNISTSGGIQNNNLNADKVSKMSRGIFAFNVAWMPTQKININANYSNFSASTRFSEALFLDSLNYIQVTKNAGLNINYLTGTEETRQMFFVMGNYQDVQDSQDNTSTLYIINGGYQVSFVPRELTFNASINFTNNTIVGLISNSAGPSLTASKSILNRKLKFNLSGTYLRSAAEGETTGIFSTMRLNTNYQYSQHHNLRAIMTYLNRETMGENARTINEFRAELSYAYTF
jgi:hypothetical protein